MTPLFNELDARAARIAGRAVVDMRVVVLALLVKARLATHTLASLSPSDLVAVLDVAREWDATDDDARDPVREELEALAAEYRGAQ